MKIILNLIFLLASIIFLVLAVRSVYIAQWAHALAYGIVFYVVYALF